MREINYLSVFRELARFAAMASIAIGLGVTLGGCSSARENQQVSWANATPPVPAPRAQQSAYVAEPGDPIKDPPIEPGRRPAAAPDDPSEPYSPNYGGQRNRPPVIVSDAAPLRRDPEPQMARDRRLSEAPRAYSGRTIATASAD